MAAARERGIKTTVHCSQHIPEFQEIVRRHGVTPVQWMHQEGLLGPDMLLGHAIFLDHHSLVQWWTRKDLDILAETAADRRGEIQLTDGLRTLRKRRPMYAVEFEGKRYDTGDKFGFLKATVEFALARPDLADAFRAYLKTLRL